MASMNLGAPGAWLPRLERMGFKKLKIVHGGAESASHGDSGPGSIISRSYGILGVSMDWSAKKKRPAFEPHGLAGRAPSRLIQVEKTMRLPGKSALFHYKPMEQGLEQRGGAKGMYLPL